MFHTVCFLTAHQRNDLVQRTTYLKMLLKKIRISRQLKQNLMYELLVGDQYTLKGSLSIIKLEIYERRLARQKCFFSP